MVLIIYSQYHMYIIKKSTIIFLAVILNLSSFSGLSFLGDETKACFATAIEAQGALISVFNLASLPVEIVNKLFKEEHDSSSQLPKKKKKKQNHTVPAAQPAISECKNLRYDKKLVNTKSDADYFFAPNSVTFVLRRILSLLGTEGAGGPFCVYFLLFLIILALANLPAYVFNKLNRSFSPGLSGPGFLF